MLDVPISFQVSSVYLLSYLYYEFPCMVKAASLIILFMLVKYYLSSSVNRY